jgi:deoxyinosine 3'endonuclease (endonuclease V)
LQVVYEDYQEVQMTVPYIPGFLAFREVHHLMQLLNRIQVSGNGVIKNLKKGEGFLRFLFYAFSIFKILNLN